MHGVAKFRVLSQSREHKISHPYRYHERKNGFSDVLWRFSAFENRHESSWMVSRTDPWKVCSQYSRGWGLLTLDVEVVGQRVLTDVHIIFSLVL